MDKVESEDERMVEILEPHAEGAESIACCLVNLSARYMRERLPNFKRYDCSCLIECKEIGLN